MGMLELPTTGPSHFKAMVVRLVDAWRKSGEEGRGGVRSCGGWCMGFQLRVLEGEGREFRECQLWA